MSSSNYLFLVHCGFYDSEVGGGIYESHCNFFVVAPDVSQARMQAKQLTAFQNKKMHVDGIQRIESVSGFKIQPIEEEKLNGESHVTSYKHRDLASMRP